MRIHAKRFYIHKIVLGTLCCGLGGNFPHLTLRDVKHSLNPGDLFCVLVRTFLPLTTSLVLSPPFGYLPSPLTVLLTDNQTVHIFLLLPFFSPKRKPSLYWYRLAHATTANRGTRGSASEGQSPSLPLSLTGQRNDSLWQIDLRRICALSKRDRNVLDHWRMSISWSIHVMSNHLSVQQESAQFLESPRDKWAVQREERSPSLFPHLEISLLLSSILMPNSDRLFNLIFCEVTKLTRSVGGCSGGEWREGRNRSRRGNRSGHTKIAWSETKGGTSNI